MYNRKFDTKHLVEALRRFSRARVLVLGDVMLDRFLWGRVERISPEAPVPVVDVESETYMLGGAANVVHNLIALGATASICGVVGEDDEGASVLKLLDDLEVPTDGIVTCQDRPTTVKTRVVAHSQQVVRVDREKKGPPARRTQEALIRRILSLLGEVRGVVFSDYRKGALSAELVREVTRAARGKGLFVAVDPKQTDFSWYRGCTLITPNKKEAEAALGGRELRSDLEVREGGKELLRKAGAEAILITRGEEGMTLVERGRKECFHIPALARQVFDVTGAGDTVIGTVAACLAAGASMREAAMLANIAASVVVGEVGTSPITAEKLLNAVRTMVQDGDG